MASTSSLSIYLYSNPLAEICLETSRCSSNLDVVVFMTNCALGCVCVCVCWMRGNHENRNLQAHLEDEHRFLKMVRSPTE